MAISFVIEIESQKSYTIGTGINNGRGKTGTRYSFVKIIIFSVIFELININICFRFFRIAFEINLEKRVIFFNFNLDKLAVGISIAVIITDILASELVVKFCGQSGGFRHGK